AFTGEGEGTPLQKIGAGLTNVGNAIVAAKNAMSEFGNVAGLAIGGLELLVPGLGTTVSAVMGILNTLGLDVKGVIDAATNALLGFMGAGGSGGSNIGNLMTMFNQIGYQINDYLGQFTDFNFSPDVLKA